MLMYKVMAEGSNLIYVGIKVPPILNIASSISWHLRFTLVHYS